MFPENDFRKKITVPSVWLRCNMNIHYHQSSPSPSVLLIHDEARISVTFTVSHQILSWNVDLRCFELARRKNFRQKLGNREWIASSWFSGLSAWLSTSNWLWVNNFQTKKLSGFIFSASAYWTACYSLTKRCNIRALFARWKFTFSSEYLESLKTSSFACNEVQWKTELMF